MFTRRWVYLNKLAVAGHPHDLLSGQSLLEQPADRLMAERRRAMETEKVEQGFPAEEGKEEGTTSVTPAAPAPAANFALLKSRSVSSTITPGKTGRPGLWRTE